MYMFNTEIQKLSQAAVNKVALLESRPGSYLILSMLAGAYVAFGIALIFFIGAPLAAAASAVTKLIMGVSFGIALTLVIFAGSELFTGNNMIGVIGAMGRHISWGQMLKLWAWCYVGNWIGSLILALLIAQSGLFAAAPQSDFIIKVAAAKMSAPFWQLFVRGILANWLVCLAVWMSGRTTSDSAKLGLIFWCLFGFIAPGFEHSIANMSGLAMALFGNHPETVTWSGYLRNLLAATAGNIVGGGFFVGALYWTVSPIKALDPATNGASTVTSPATVPAQA
jgi:nitrite transporter